MHEERSGLGPFAFLRRHPALWTAAGLLLLSIVIVRVAKSRPGFDPYGWLVWGHQTLHLIARHERRAVMEAAAVRVHGALRAVRPLSTVAVDGECLCAGAERLGVRGRIAFRLTAAPPGRRWAAWIAALFAGLCVLGINNYVHYTLSAQSDPMIVALVLAAVDCGLSGRRRWALACALLASLGRPEAWPFLALYAGCLWRSEAAMRPYVLGAVVVLLLLWFGIPAISSRSLFVAADNAMNSGQAVAGDKLTGVLRRFVDINATPVDLAALLGCALGAWRRDRRIVGLAAGVVVWVLVEIAFAYHGWPALQRYMFEAGGVMIVLAAVAVGRLLVEPPSLRGPAGVLCVAAVCLLAGSLVPTAVHRVRPSSRTCAPCAAGPPISRASRRRSPHTGAEHGCSPAAPRSPASPTSPRWRGLWGSMSRRSASTSPRASRPGARSSCSGLQRRSGAG